MPGPKVTTLISIAVETAADSKMEVSKPEQYMPERFRITGNRDIYVKVLGRVYVCFMKVKNARTDYVKVGPVPFRVLAQNKSLLQVILQYCSSIVADI